jgi:hypothetical protein
MANFLPCNRNNLMKITSMNIKITAFVPFLSSILICAPLFLSAQNDYALTFKGDTVKGEIRILSYDLLDRVQINVQGKKTTLTALQVKSIKKNNNYYEAVRYDNSVRFMQVLKSGYLSYYAFNPTSQITWDGRFLYKRDGKGVELPNLSFKKILINFLSECPNICDRISHGEFARKDIEKIIDLYNECLQSKTEALNLVPSRTNNENATIVSAIKNLTTKIEAENFLTKKDALDVLKDIQTKVAQNEKVPNYLIDGLKSYLLDTPALTKDLDQVIALLKK